MRGVWNEVAETSIMNREALMTDKEVERNLGRILAELSALDTEAKSAAQWVSNRPPMAELPCEDSEGAPKAVAAHLEKVAEKYHAGLHGCFFVIKEAQRRYLALPDLIRFHLLQELSPKSANCGRCWPRPPTSRCETTP